MALEIQPRLLARRAVSKGHVIVGDIIEEVDFVLVKGETGADGMDGRVAPALVEESAVLVQLVEEVGVGRAAQPIEVADFKVGPEVAVVVGFAVVVGEEGHAVVRGDVFWVVLHEGLDAVPERRDRLDVFVEGEDEGVFLVVVGHELERVVVDVAVELDRGFNTPVPFVLEHERVTEEEAALVAAHVAVGDAVTVDDFALVHVLAHLGGLVLVNEGREAPVLAVDFAVTRAAGCQRAGDGLEGLVELGVVEEDPIVVVFPVEAVFHLPDATRDFPNVAVARKGYKSRIHALAGGWGVCEGGLPIACRWVGGGCMAHIRNRRVFGYSSFIELWHRWLLLVCNHGCARSLLQAITHALQSIRGVLEVVPSRDRARTRIRGGDIVDNDQCDEGEEDVAQIARVARHLVLPIAGILVAVGPLDGCILPPAQISPLFVQYWRDASVV